MTKKRLALWLMNPRNLLISVIYINVKWQDRNSRNFNYKKRNGLGQPQNQFGRDTISSYSCFIEILYIFCIILMMNVTNWIFFANFALFSEQFRNPMGGNSGMRTYILERRTCDALCLTARNLAVSKLSVKNQSNKDAHGYVISDISRIYTYQRGLRRCSFRQIGRCQSLETWDE